jgi:hypothetical protein
VEVRVQVEAKVDTASKLLHTLLAFNSRRPRAHRQPRVRGVSTRPAMATPTSTTLVRARHRGRGRRACEANHGTWHQTVIKKKIAHRKCRSEERDGLRRRRRTRRRRRRRRRTRGTTTGDDNGRCQRATRDAVVQEKVFERG